MAWTDRYVRADAAGGGNGTTDTNSGVNGAYTLAEAAAAAVGGWRINVRSGTYSNGATAVTLGAGGSTGAPVWWRGFNTTIGDIDTNNTLTKPLIDFTTGNLVINSAFHYFSGLRFNSAAITGTNPGTVSSTGLGADCQFWRCRITNTGTDANSFAFRPVGARNRVVASYLSSTTSAHVVSLQNNDCAMLGCYIEGGNTGIVCGNRCYMLWNIIDDPALHGIDCAASGSVIGHNSIWSAGTDGIRCANTATLLHIFNNVIAASGGWGINFSAGNNGASIVYDNAYRSNTSGEVNGLTEGWRWGEQSLAADPFTNPAANDFSLVSSAASGGYPGDFENTSNVGYLDPGAVQRQPSGASTFVFNLEG